MTETTYLSRISTVRGAEEFEPRKSVKKMLPCWGTLKDLQESSTASFIPESLRTTKSCSRVNYFILFCSLRCDGHFVPSSHSLFFFFQLLFALFMAGDSATVKKQNKALPIAWILWPWWSHASPGWDAGPAIAESPSPLALAVTSNPWDVRSTMSVRCMETTHWS